MATKAKRFIPEGYTTVTPYLTVRSGEEALAFYKKAFNASEIYKLKKPDGRVGHAELQIGNARVMVGEPMGGSTTMGGTAGSLCLYVEDADQLFKQGVSAGGKEVMAVQDMYWGDRAGTFADPFGHTWTVCTHKEDLTPQEIEQRMKEQAPSKK
jgi:PhnB protein